MAVQVAAALAGGDGEDGGVRWQAFLGAAVRGVADGETGLVLLPALTWAALPAKNCLARANDLFQEASLLQRKVSEGARWRGSHTSRRKAARSPPRHPPPPPLHDSTAPCRVQK